MNQVTIKQMSVKELKSALRGRDWFNTEEVDGAEKVYVGSRLSGVDENGRQISHLVHATKQEIRDELALRPHVPSKREGALLRRLMSQTGMSEKELRANPKYGKELVDIQQSHPRRVITKDQAKWYQKVYGKKMFQEFFYVEGKTR